MVNYIAPIVDSIYVQMYPISVYSYNWSLRSTNATRSF